MNISRLIMTVAVFAIMAGPTFADNKRAVCHKGRTISVDRSAVQAHLDRHGDTRGACPVKTISITAVIMMRCLNNEGMLQVSGLSASDDAYVKPIIEEQLSCAVEVAHAMNIGYKLQNVHTGLIDGETEYLFIKDIPKP